MKRIRTLSLAAAFLVALANPGLAACYADYKAKRDKPLRLHYGVIELDGKACDDADLARSEIGARLAVGNWELLNVLSIFGQGGLKEREQNAGRFFLRY